MIPFAEGYAVRDAAAVAARQCIDADIERAESRLRPALRYLREHLFDPELTVGDLRAATGIESARFYALFRAATGAKPRDYFAAFRLQTGAAILRETDLDIGDVASVVGYESLKTFRLRFRAVFGMPPGRYRDEHGEQPGAREDALAMEVPHWRRAFAHWATAETRDRTTRVRTAAELEESATRRAQQAWAIARGLSERTRRQLVAFVGCSTPALAEHLFVRSRIEGRGDRAWGVEVAKLAQGAIPEHTNDVWTGQSLREARIRAHAWLGNAYRLLLELTPAADAFAHARHLMQAAGESSVSALARAELASLEASLGWIRSDYSRASKLVNEAVALAEGGASAFLVPALRQRAAIAADAGHVAESMEDLRRCLDVLGPGAEAEARLAIHHALAQSSLRLGNAEEAAEHLALAEGLSLGSRDPRLEASLVLARGRLEWLRQDLPNAWRLLARALTAFEAQDSRFDIIVTMTDLCLIKLEADDTLAALDYARQLLPALRLLNADQPWRQLVRELQASVAQRCLEIDVLRRVKRALPAIAARGATTSLSADA